MHLTSAQQSVTQDDFEGAMLVPPYKASYSLLFGTLDYFVLIRRIVMIYERFIIAKQLIAEKLAEDINNEKILDQTLKQCG